MQVSATQDATESMKSARSELQDAVDNKADSCSLTLHIYHACMQAYPQITEHMESVSKALEAFEVAANFAKGKAGKPKAKPASSA